MVFGSGGPLGQHSGHNLAVQDPSLFEPCQLNFNTFVRMRRLFDGNILNYHRFSR